MCNTQYLDIIMKTFSDLHGRETPVLCSAHLFLLFRNELIITHIIMDQELVSVSQFNQLLVHAYV